MVWCRSSSRAAAARAYRRGRRGKTASDWGRPASILKIGAGHKDLARHLPRLASPYNIPTIAGKCSEGVLPPNARAGNLVASPRPGAPARSLLHGGGILCGPPADHPSTSGIGPAGSRLRCTLNSRIPQFNPVKAGWKHALIRDRVAEFSVGVGCTQWRWRGNGTPGLVLFQDLWDKPCFECRTD